MESFTFWNLKQLYLEFETLSCKRSSDLENLIVVGFYKLMNWQTFGGLPAFGGFSRGPRGFGAPGVRFGDLNVY